MAHLRNIAFAGLAALGLTACNNADGRGGMAVASGVCKPFTTAAAGTQPASAPGVNAMGAPVAAADPSTGLDDCLHRWGYALAPSTDAANTVADAALAACSTALTAWNQSALASGAQQAPSLVNGQPTNPLSEHYAFAQARALFYVVQARAGHCAPPPLKAGQPTS